MRGKWCWPTVHGFLWWQPNWTHVLLIPSRWLQMWWLKIADRNYWERPILHFHIDPVFSMPFSRIISWMVCPQGHRCGLQGGGENQVSEESSLWTACLSFRQWHEAHSDCNTPLGHKKGAKLVCGVLLKLLIISLVIRYWKNYSRMTLKRP